MEEIAICLIFLVPKSAGGWQLCARDLLRAGALGRRLHVEIHQKAPDAPVLERSILTVPKAVLSSTEGCQRERQARRVSERCVQVFLLTDVGPKRLVVQLGHLDLVAFLLALKMQQHSIDAKVFMGCISMYFAFQPWQIKQ